MNCVLLAVVLSTPTTTEGACDDHEMQVMISAPGKDSALYRQELDRRNAIVLADERSVQGGMQPAPPPSLSAQLGVPAGVALVGLIIVLLAAGRRARAFAVAGALCCMVGATLALRSLDKLRRTDDRLIVLRDCRLRILEARSALEHSDLARCMNDVAEVDEDLMVFETRLKGQGAVTLAEVQKLRGEIGHR